MTQYRRIAQIVKTKGLKGEIVAKSGSSLPLHFWEGVQLHIVPPEYKLPRSTEVAEAKQLDLNSFLLKLTGIDDKTAAQLALGHYLLAQRKDCPELQLHDENTVVGMQLEDIACGLIGTIIEERFGSAQDIWVVEGSFGEVLIPAADELIVSRTERCIVMDLPRGLLELNQ